MTPEAVDPWEEPVRGGYPHPSLAALPGFERQRRFAEFGPAPPIHFLIGTQPTGSGRGAGWAVMPATGWLLSPQGRIPLGVLAILADLGFGLAAGSQLAAGANFTTAELSLTRLSSPALGGELTTEGRMLHSTETMGLSEAKVFDAEGRMVAAGTSRLAVFPPPGELPEIPDPLPPVEQPDSSTPPPYQRPPQGEVLGEALWRSHSGLEILQRLAKGDLPLPPIGRLTGLRVTEVAEGRARVVLPASEWLASPAGTVQGGFTAMVADAALQCAIQTTVEAGDTFAPLDVKVNFLRPVLPDGRLVTADAEVSHRGRSLAVAHATLVDADGRRVALATGSAALGSTELL